MKRRFISALSVAVKKDVEKNCVNATLVETIEEAVRLGSYEDKSSFA